jgi:hypothetical protein
MEVVERLAAIDEIRQLKARYFRFCDLMELEGFLDVFTPDATLVYDLDLPEQGPPQQMRFTGRHELEAFCRAIRPLRPGAGRWCHRALGAANSFSCVS